MVVDVNGKVKRAWFVFQWCGGIYKGILMVYGMLQYWGSSLVKSEVEWLLDNGVRFEWEMARVCYVPWCACMREGRRGSYVQRSKIM